MPSIGHTHPTCLACLEMGDAVDDLRGEAANLRAALEELATHHFSRDYESCDYCGCDAGGGMSPWQECHDDWCPTVIARKALGVPLNQNIKAPCP